MPKWPKYPWRLFLPFDPRKLEYYLKLLVELKFVEYYTHFAYKYHA